MKRVGWAPAGAAGDCERPLEIFNDVTGVVACRYVRCRSTRLSRCSTCATKHRRNVARVGRSGWADRPSDRGYFVTLTAPGEDLLPWDKSQCLHGDETPCSGAIGCRCELEPLRAWNDSLGMRWTHFVTYLRRALPDVDVQFFKTYEPQRRGAQHAHIMFRFAGIVTDSRIRAALRWAAGKEGFGKQLKVDAVDLSNGLQIARTAGYCAKYAAKSADADRSMIDTATGEIVTVHLRPWSKSARWGDSMKGIQAAQRTWASSAGGRPAGVPAQAPGGGAALDLNSDFYTDRESMILVVDHVGASTAM